MSGRRKEREVYVSEPSSSPQFQQQRPPLFPKETWTCFVLSAALPIFHQNRILNSSNFEHEMPGEVLGERDTIPLSIQLQTVCSDSSAGFCTTAAWRLAPCFSNECKIKHARGW
ncbi:uncharacterized protein [Malus domestica]|uniref:uncharacterized protein isoform X1 n=1 Tax=Malus domestica TaxID=3750 RepID=UPI0039763FA1